MPYCMWCRRRWPVNLTRANTELRAEVRELKRRIREARRTLIECDMDAQTVFEPGAPWLTELLDLRRRRKVKRT